MTDRGGDTGYATVYGEEDRAVVLAHGGRFKEESWQKQAQTLAYWRSISAATVIAKSRGLRPDEFMRLADPILNKIGIEHCHI